MKHSKPTPQTMFRLCAIAAAIVFAFFFPDILLYVFLAYIFALMCKPFMLWLEKIKLFKHPMPRVLSTLLAMLFYIFVFYLMLYFFIPTLVKEVSMLENIDYAQLTKNLDFLLADVENFLHDKNFLGHEHTIVGLLTTEIKGIVNIGSFSRILGNVANFTGSFFMASFTILFVTFFFLKDNFKLAEIMQVFISDNHLSKMKVVAEKINHLLTRYFVGTVVRLVIMIILLYAGMAIFGIKGALFLGFLGGLLNIIPYLGPIIGAVIACLFGLIDGISTQMYAEIIPDMIKIIGVFVAANVIDNIVLQPVIFSQSVKAHPVEIFLVTIIGGNVAGIAGMILAIPVYTIIRVVVIEIYRSVYEPPKIITPDSISSGD